MEISSETVGLEAVKSLMPVLKVLTSESVHKYFEICKEVRPSATDYISQLCLICPKDATLSGAIKHIEIARHTKTIGTLCSHCNMFLISNEEIGFKQHLLISHHLNIVKFRFKRDGMKMSIPKEVSQKVSRLIEDLERKTVAEPVKAEAPPQPAPLVPLPPTSVPLPEGKQSTVTSSNTNIRRKTTFNITGLSRDLDPMEFYRTLQQYGRVIFFSIHVAGFSLYVTFDPLITQHLNSHDFGRNVRISQVRSAKKIIDEIVENKNQEWTIWEHSDITPECKEVFSIKRVWENHLDQVWRNCETTAQRFEVTGIIIKQKLEKALKPYFPRSILSFYGPYITGLVDTCDFLYIYMNGVKDGVKSDNIFDTFRKMQNNDFKVFKEIKGHKELSFVVLNNPETKCVFTVNSLSSFESTLLIKTLMDFDPRAKWLVLTLREWWRLNDYTGSSIFSLGDGILEWLILFFLMLPQIMIVPNVMLLVEIGSDPSKLVEGQVNFFSTDLDLIAEHHETKCEMEGSRLLIECLFFLSNLNLHASVLCLYTGTFYNRNEFFYNSGGMQKSMSEKPFVMLHPLDRDLNLLSDFTKEDYYTFRNKVVATIDHMIKC